MADSDLTNVLQAVRNDLMTMPAYQVLSEYVAPRVLEYVPDSAYEWPVVFVAPSAGSCHLSSHANERGNSAMMCMHRINIEIHIPHTNTPTDAQQMTWLADGLLPWLYGGFARDRFEGTIVTPGNPRTSNNAADPLTYQIGESALGDTVTLAWVGTFEVVTEQELMP